MEWGPFSGAEHREEGALGLAVWDSHLGPLSDWPGGSKPSSGQFPGCFRRWPRLSHTEEPPVHRPALFIDAGPGSGHQEPLETVPASFLQQRLCVAGGGGGGTVLCSTLLSCPRQIRGHRNSGAPRLASSHCSLEL